jgi:hypothetical protein
LGDIQGKRGFKQKGEALATRKRVRRRLFWTNVGRAGQSTCWTYAVRSQPKNPNNSHPTSTR